MLHLSHAACKQQCMCMVQSSISVSVGIKLQKVQQHMQSAAQTAGMHCMVGCHTSSILSQPQAMTPGHAQNCPDHLLLSSPHSNGTLLMLRAVTGADYKTSVWDVGTWKEVTTGRGKPFAKHPVQSIVYSGRAGANGLATPPLLIASDEGPAVWGM